MPRSPALIAFTTVAALSASALAQPTFPNECDSTATRFLALAAYFGGVSAFGVEIVPTALHSGGSLRCWANFRHDNFFRIAGFTVGASTIARPAFSTPAVPAFFSLAVDVPNLQGKQLKLRLVLREDDNNNGIIDAIEEDDEWEASVILSTPGVRTINIPLASFVDTNPLTGNDTKEFATINRIGINITFETRQDLPGGIIEVPVSLRVDHVGLYDVAQSIPVSCRADFDTNGLLSAQDIFDFLNAWFALDHRADFTPGVLDVQDIFDYLNAWFAGC